MKGRARLHTSHVPSGLHFICFYVQALGLEFYPATLFINMCPFLPAPSVKGARWEACDRSPTVPALPLPFYHMASEPFIQNDFETLLLIFLSLSVHTLPLSIFL